VTCQIRFAVAKLSLELRGLASVARPFLTPLGQRSLVAANDQVAALIAGPSATWTVTADTPIQTKSSSMLGRPVFAEISFVLDVSSVMGRKKSQRPSAFDVNGQASIEVRLYEGTPPLGSAANSRPAGIWHFDVGINSSPGCHFHAQLPWRKLQHVTWDLSIPRLPSLIVSPVDVIDFVLGELFQQLWLQQCIDKSADAAQWGGGQLRRLQVILDWHRTQLPDGVPLPWLTLKRAKPTQPLPME
jgi:hypothetical protein